MEGDALQLLTEPLGAHPDVLALIETVPEAERTAKQLQRERLAAFGKTVAELASAENKSEGAVVLFSGPMRSGKSHLGLSVAEFYDKQLGSSVLFTKPSIDDRSPTMESHNGSASESCVPIETLLEGVSLLEPDILIVDEYQFLPEEDRVRADRLIIRRANKGKHTILCMLNRDFRGKKWTNYDQARYLIEQNVGIHFKLHAICECCGGSANRTQREVQIGPDSFRPARIDESVISVEGSSPERYSARCKNCHEVAPALSDDLEI